MKREALTEKLARIISQIETQTDLPLDIREVHIYGSYARGDMNPGDLDLVLVHEKLTPEQDKIALDNVFGHGTSLEQKMNGRIKSARENIDVLYGASFETATSQIFGMGVHFKIWSKEDRDWRAKIAQLESLVPEERARILDQEIENLRRSITHLQENILAFQRARLDLDSEAFRRFEEARSREIDTVRKEKMVGKVGLELL